VTGYRGKPTQAKEQTQLAYIRG